VVGAGQGDRDPHLERALAGGPVTNIRETTTPAGRAVEADIDVHSHHGDAVLLPVAGEVYELIFLNAGSVKATEDFSRMLGSIRVG
jgi:hypothetical protein